jgi:dihydrofolate reductase
MTEARAYVMGRNMFGPLRGAWDRQWNGWWGVDPPFHAPVFVLTHHPRDPQPMVGGTTFSFVTDGIESALNQAREAAGDGDVSIQGGASTINEYLAAGLIDELRLHIVPLTLGAGSRLIRRRPAAESRAGGVAGNPLGHTCHLPRAALS